MERAQRGDHDAFDELVGQYGRDLYRLAVVVAGFAEAGTYPFVTHSFRDADRGAMGLITAS